MIASYPFLFRSDDATEVGDASISSNLRILVDPGLRESLRDKHRVTVKVVGYDLVPFIRETYPGWRTLLDEWLELGVQVEYIALGDPETTLSTLRQSSASTLLAARKGSLKIFGPADLSKIKPPIVKTIEMLREAHRTSHFMLIVDEDEEASSQMWLEGVHLPNETDAQDCWHFGPSVAYRSPEFTQNLVNFAFLKKYSEEFSVQLGDQGG